MKFQAYIRLYKAMMLLLLIYMELEEIKCKPAFTYFMQLAIHVKFLVVHSIMVVLVYIKF